MMREWQKEGRGVKKKRKSERERGRERHFWRECFTFQSLLLLRTPMCHRRMVSQGEKKKKWRTIRTLMTRDSLRKSKKPYKPRVRQIKRLLSASWEAIPRLANAFFVLIFVSVDRLAIFGQDRSFLPLAKYLTFNRWNLTSSITN